MGAVGNGLLPRARLVPAAAALLLYILGVRHRETW